MATSFTLVGGTVAETAAALTRLDKCRVVYTASIGDAASPVFVLAGPHRTSAGQVATYGHDVVVWARRQKAASVIGHWDNDRGWMQTVRLVEGSAVTPEQIAEAVGRRTLASVEAGEARRHRQMVEDMERREAERPDREARMAKYAAECAARAEEYRPIFEAARARLRLRTNGLPRRDDSRTLEWAFGKACGTTDCYGDYDRQHGLLVLRRLAERGFADEVATA